MENPIVWTIIKALIVAGVVISAAAGELLIERKFLGYFTYRLGPNRVGPWGAFQPVADVIKMAFKETIVPKDADKLVFNLAPIIAMFTALAAFVVIPWGPGPGNIMADTNAGILVFLAIGSLSVYGVTLGGWASQSKYSLLGSMRSTAQMISYELAMSMSVLGVILMGNSLKLGEIVGAQQGLYNIIPQFLGFVVFCIAALAETARVPFDLPESETELVGGYNTEYAGMKFGLFFIGEIVHMLNMSAMITLLYLGGWNRISFLAFIPPVVAFLLKICLLVFIFIWIRATWPRLRYDRLMVLGWKVMLPLAALNLLGTAIYVAVFAPKA